MVTRVFVYDLIFPHLLQRLLKVMKDWGKVSDKYFIIQFIRDDPVQPEIQRDDILIDDEESAARFIDRIRREAEEWRRGEVR